MDKETIIAAYEFGRARLIGSLEAFEKKGADPAKVLAWRPGPGRAHIAWQALHCAATHDRYINVRLKGGKELDLPLCQNYGGGSTPSDANIPSLAEIRKTLDLHYANAIAYIRSLSADDMKRVIDFPNNMKRSMGESLILLAWHEAHHQGQIHLTWNLYKAANGIA